MRNNNYSLAGSSFLLNLIFILINLIGLTLLVFGYHPSFEKSALLFKVLGYSSMGLSLILIYVFKGWLLFSYISRILVGGLFIVSGLIKANDPLGFSYKLEEYFEDGALAFRIKEWFHWDSFSLEFLIEHALTLSVIICIIEIVLGALILLGAKFKTSTWLMLFMMLFFTFLTWHTKECDPNATFKDIDTYAINSPIAQVKLEQAEYDENITILEQTDQKIKVQEIKKTQCVDDCGCFGDAMKGSIGRSLTPAESYWKDIILLYLVIILFISRRRVPLNSQEDNIVFIALGSLFITLFSFIFSWYFPVLFGLIALFSALWIKKKGGKSLGDEWGMILILTLLSGLFVTYVLLYLPLRDYRPYHVGSNLIERMNDGKEGVYENIMVYTNLQTQQDTTITLLDESTKDIWGNAEVWQFKNRETKTLVPAILPSIQQFNPSINVEDLTEIEKEFDPIRQILEENQVPYITLIDRNDGTKYPMMLEDFYLPDLDTALYEIGDTTYALSEELTDISLQDYILSQEQIILIFSRHFDQGNFQRMERLKSIAENAKQNNIPMLVISTVSKERVEAFREEYGLYLPTLQNDEIEIKAITRSNPSLMVLKNGVVKGKYPHRSIPSWEWLIENILELN